MLAAALLGATGLSACEPVDHDPPTAVGTERVVIFGDSVPSGLVGTGSATGLDQKRFTLLNGTISACDSALPFYEERSASGKLVDLAPGCSDGWSVHYPQWLATHADVAIVMGGVHAMLDHRIDGTWTHPCTPVARDWVRDDLAARIAYLREHASEVVVVLPAWPGPLGRFIMPADYLARADCVRQALADGAAAGGATTRDLGTYLCPTSPTSCLPYREADGIHIDPVHAGTVLRWVLDPPALPITNS